MKQDLLQTALKLLCPLKAAINLRRSMGVKFAVSALYVDTFRVIVTENPPTYKGHSGKKVK